MGVGIKKPHPNFRTSRSRHSPKGRGALRSGLSVTEKREKDEKETDAIATKKSPDNLPRLINTFLLI